ncbi:hypothetical protein Tsubulata_008081 [Turnera subulata]|uniref:DUF4005 domain-containing protein n=1 Tax=Turnera subulata TaxID=218843 RepID=A0A9Q0FCQ4_9ROSI|nr:hypothetical protein Tsubulata_008081 [Turnera subulata]
MGKASKWFRAILGLKKQQQQQQQQPEPSKSNPRCMSFVKSSSRERDQQPPTKPAPSPWGELLYADQAEHAIAVAQATAAAAEAAAEAAKAAARLVRLTSSRRFACGVGSYLGRSSCAGVLDPELAAVKIQSVFRGYLARRGLRALRAIVKMQALVRGHIQRKRTADWLHRMEAMLRARSGRSQIISESSQPVPATSEKFEHVIRAKSGKYYNKLASLAKSGKYYNKLASLAKRGKYYAKLASLLKKLGSKSNGRAIGDQDATHPSFNWSEQTRNQRPLTSENSDKVQEIDPKRLCSSHHALASDQYSHSFTWASSRGGRKSDGYPNYMSNTEFSRAKVRSLSAHYERSSSTKWYSLSFIGGTRPSRSQRASTQAWDAGLQTYLSYV